MESEEQRNCANCKKDVAAANFDLHYVYCSRNLILCHMCDEPVPIGDKDHIKEKHTRVPCEDCGRSVERWELDGHHKTLCPKRLETCQFCDIELTFDSLQAHVNYCGTRTEPCSMCRKNVMIKEKENHTKENCPKRVVSCPYCQSHYPFDKSIEHLRFCMANSKSSYVETEVGEAKGYHLKGLHTKELTSGQDDEAVPPHKERITLFKCHHCNECVPKNQFRDHYKVCNENSRTSNQLPRHTEMVNKSYKHIQSNYEKREPSDITSFDNVNEATKKSQSITTCQPKKYQGLFAFENPNGTDGKCDAASVHCKFCGCQCDANELKEHQKHCDGKRYVTCVCGAYVMAEELQNHRKECPRRFKICKLCNKKCTQSEYEDHLKLCSTSVMTCDLCSEEFFRFQQKDHTCTVSIKMKNKTHKLQQNDDLTSVKQPENDESESEDCKKTECCKFCQRHFPLNILKEHLSSCFMSPVKCRSCHKVFPLDEVTNHVCLVPSKNNRLKSEGPKLKTTDDRVLVDSLESRSPLSGSKHQQNNKVIQSLNQSVKHKCHMEDGGEYHIKNLNCGTQKDELNSYADVHKQTSSGVTAQDPNGAFEKHHIEPCEFCNFPLKPEEMDEHMLKCDAYCVPCGICKAYVKFGELEEHKKLCNKKGNCCQFCKKCYPPSEFEEHVEFCSVTCLLCKKAFPRDEFEIHFCQVDVCDQNRRQADNHNSKHIIRKGRRNPKCVQKNIEVDENRGHSQPMEVDEQNESALEGNHQAEASSSVARELVLHSPAEGVAANNVQFNQIYFDCQVCRCKNHLENLSIEVFNMNKTPVCKNCVRNIQQLHPNFHEDVNSCANNMKDSGIPGLANADAIEKKKKPQQDVKSCDFCESYLPVDDIDEHKKNCENRPYECHKCQNLVLLGYREMHSQICDGQKLGNNSLGADGGSAVNSTGKRKGGRGEKKPCQYCEEIPIGGIKTHEKNCGMRFTECNKCKRTVQFRYLKNSCESGHQKKQESVRPPGTASRVPPGSKEEKENTANEKIQAAGSTDQEACEYCQKIMSYATIADHRKSCEMRMKSCLFCDMVFPLCKKQQHLEQAHFTARQEPSDYGGQQKKEDTGSRLIEKLRDFMSGSGRGKHSDCSRQERQSNSCGSDSRQLPARHGNACQSHNHDQSSEGHVNRESAHPTTLHQREELVGIPCEFCEKLCTPDELIKHESGCRPELFTGNSEHDSNGDDTPQNRRRVDDAPVSRSGRNDNNLQRSAMFGQERGLQESWSGNRVNVFDDHPLANEEELADKRAFHQNPRFSDNSDFEINMTSGKRNALTHNPREGAKQPENSHKEFQYVGRQQDNSQAQSQLRSHNSHCNDDDDDDGDEKYFETEEDQIEDKYPDANSQCRKLPPHHISDENHIHPREKNDESFDFVYVAKADKGVHVDTLNEHYNFHAEEHQQSYRGGRPYRKVENVHNDYSRHDDQHFSRHSNDRKPSDQYKTSCNENNFSKLESGDGYELSRKHTSDRSLSLQMQSISRPQIKSSFRDYETENEEFNFQNENTVKKSRQYPGSMAEQYTEHHEKHHMQNDHFRDDPQDVMSMQRGNRRTMSTKNFDDVADRSSNPKYSSKQHEFNPSYTAPRDSDRQQENFHPASRKLPEKSGQVCQNDTGLQHYGKQGSSFERQNPNVNYESEMKVNSNVKGRRTSERMNSHRSQQNDANRKSNSRNTEKRP